MRPPGPLRAPDRTCWPQTWWRTMAGGRFRITSTRDAAIADMGDTLSTTALPQCPSTMTRSEALDGASIQAWKRCIARRCCARVPASSPGSWPRRATPLGVSPQRCRHVEDVQQVVERILGQQRRHRGCGFVWYWPVGMNGAAVNRRGERIAVGVCQGSGNPGCVPFREYWVALTLLPTPRLLLESV